MLEAVGDLDELGRAEVVGRGVNLIEGHDPAQQAIGSMGTGEGISGTRIACVESRRSAATISSGR